jgi:F-type H+-transporting ATPase subunit b
MQPLVSLAAANAHPIIDLDSTVFVQLAIFIVTALALSKFLFKPYLAVRAQRGAGMEGARDEARRLDEEAAARLADYESALAAAKSRASAERGKLQSEAVARERAIADAARASTQEALGVARSKLAADAAAARAQLEPRAQEIARGIFHKILGREAA